MLGSRGAVRARVLVCLSLYTAVLIAGAARADDTSAVQDIVAILREKGLIDQTTGDEILAKQASSDAKAAKAAATPSVSQGLLEGFIWSGDLRLRDEQFWYMKGMGADGVSANDNNRIRYRARIGFTKQINDWALIGVRIATDTTDYRSTNISAGETSDFQYDSVFFDKVYATFLVPDPGIGLKTSLTAGKMTNPFLWKNTMERIIWDEDITPEGVALSSTWAPTENTKLFMNLGYFVELQNATQTDPRVYGYQLGGSVKVPEAAVEVGARASYYDWRHLANDANSATHTGFFARTFANGNLPNGFDPDMHIIESTGYVTWSGLEEWPITLWGTWAQNLSADGGVVKGVSIGAQDQAFGVGVEGGDAKRWFRAGAAFNHVEANAVVAQYTDSDMFDGRTNREGWALYIWREILPNTELRFTLWDQHPIKTTASGLGNGPFNISATTDSQASRRRGQFDVNFKF